MRINKNVIIYFSGTGNSLYVAKNIGKSLDYELINVKDINDLRLDFRGSTLGLVFPTYYARVPKIMEEFISKLTISSDAYLFVVITHGGGPSIVLNRLKKILSDKVDRSSGFLVKMPGNNIFNYGAADEKKILRTIHRSDKRIIDIVKRIQENECKWDRSYILIDTAIDLIFGGVTDKIIADIKRTSESFTVDDTCSSCQQCAVLCPGENIYFNKNLPYWRSNCEKCGACIQWCPNQSIDWKGKTSKRKRYRNPFIEVSELKS